MTGGTIDGGADIVGAYGAALRAYRGGVSAARARPGDGSTIWSAVDRESGMTVAALLAHCADAAGDPLYGLRFAREVDPARFGLLGVVAAMAEDLGGALSTFVRCRAAMSTLGTIRLEVGRRWVDIVWQGTAGTPSQVGETAMAGWLAFARRVGAEPIALEHVAFAHARGPRPDQMEALLEAPVVVGAGCNRLRIRRDALAIPQRTAHPALFQALRPWLERQATLQQADSTGRIERVQRTMVAQWRDAGAVQESALAQQLGCSTRTLQRRLATGHGLSFRDLCDTLRVSAAACALVQRTERQVDIAAALGFAEQSSFSRAMREWTGFPPSALQAWAGEASAVFG